MNNDISKYFTTNNTQIQSDTAMVSLANNTVVKNINSGVSYKKVGSNIFDKVPTEVDINIKAVLYTAQSLTSSQRSQARENIGLGSLATTITNLTNRITALENSSSGNGSLTFGSEFEATIVSVAMLSESIPTGTILNPSLYYCSDATTHGPSGTFAEWKLYRGTYTPTNQPTANKQITNGSYIVTQDSTVTPYGSEEYGIGRAMHTFKLRKITGINGGA